MSMLAPDLPDAEVLDLFAGSGALGLEALSRGARHATFVERERVALDALKRNIEELGARDLTTVVTSDALRYLEDVDDLSFDIAFADPPYGRGLAARTLDRFQRGPFARILALEHHDDDRLTSPEGSRLRRYGATRIVLVPSTAGREESR